MFFFSERKKGGMFHVWKEMYKDYQHFKTHCPGVTILRLDNYSGYRFSVHI